MQGFLDKINIFVDILYRLRYIQIMTKDFTTAKIFGMNLTPPVKEREARRLCEVYQVELGCFKIGRTWFIPIGVKDPRILKHRKEAGDSAQIALDLK